MKNNNEIDIFECLDKMTVRKLFELQVAKSPNVIAIEQDDRKLSYLELNNWSNAIASKLIENGTKKGDVVAVAAQRSIEAVVGIIAVLKTGAAYVPLDMDQGEERTQYIQKDSGAKFMLIHQIEPVGNLKCYDISDFQNIEIENFEIEDTPEDMMYLLYTSGTTGKPKGVQICQKSVLNMLRHMRIHFYRNSKGKTPLFTSHCFDFAVPALFGTLLFGDTIKIFRDGIEMADSLKTEKMSLIKITPSYFMVLADSLRRTAKDRVDTVVFGGEVLTEEVVETARSIFGDNTRIYNEYGPTESTVFVTETELKPGCDITIGKPIEGCRVYIIKDGKKCKNQEIGELCIAGVGLAQGYYNDKELTSKKFYLEESVDEVVYHTGDLACFREDGLIIYHGRMDEQIKIRGYRVELAEVENVLRQIEGIKNTAIIVRKGKDGENSLYAYYVADTNLNLSKIKEIMHKLLPSYMMPSGIKQVPFIPVTANGKVDRNALLEFGIDRVGKGVAVQTAEEDIVKVIFEEVLDIENVGRKESFIDLGGSSLKAMRAINRIEERFRVRLNTMDFLKDGTPEIIAKKILTKINKQEKFYTNKDVCVISNKTKKEGYPITDLQRQIYLSWKANSDGISLNLPFAVKMRGNLSEECLEKAFQALVDRHESFRTYFVEENGECIQRVVNTLRFNLIKCVEKVTNVEDYFRKFIRPFELSKAPLLRAELVKTDIDEWILFVDMSHIIADGMSKAIFAEELSSLYNKEELQPINITYTDYCCWCESRDLENQHAYWNTVFEEPTDVLELPTDFPRERMQGQSGGKISRKLSGKLKAKINNFCKYHGMTQYMVWLGGLMILLSEYSGQDDINIGTVAAGRTRKETENIIGMFVNTVIMRGNPNKEKKVITFLEEIRNISVLAYENQEYPYWKLGEEKGGKREISRNPLFDVMLVLQNGEAMNYTLKEVESTLIFDGTQDVQFDLTFQVIQRENEEEISLEYRKELYSEKNIYWMLEHYVACVEWMLDHIEQKIGEVVLITPDETNIILTQFNNTSSVQYGKNNVNEIFKEKVQCYPDKVAIQFDNLSVSYAELDRWSDFIAGILYNEGIRQGDTVAVIMNREISVFAGILGIEKVGGVYMPVDPTLPVERIIYMLQDSNAKLILTKDNVTIEPDLDVWKQVNITYIPKNYEYAEYEEISLKPDDPSYLIYTSGTTGKPKGVLVNHRGITNLSNYFVSSLKITPDDRILQFANLVFDASIWEITMSLFTGATMVILPENIKLDILKCEAYLKNNKVTVATLPPNYFMQLQDINLRLIITAGSRADKKILEKSKGKQYVNAYGPTETTVCATHWEWDKISFPDNIPIGKPILNTQVYIRSNDKLCGIGIPGELCIAGEGVARGYLNKESLTNEKFIDNPFGDGKLYRSGDLARWLPDGNIDFLGRIDEQVKIRGFRIELGEIESTLRQISHIDDAAVVIITDEYENKEICAYFVSKNVFDIKTIKKILSDRLPNYMVPAYIMQIDKIPLTRSGKLDKKLLPKIQRVKENYLPPETSKEIVLCNVLQEVLGEVKIGIQDNFFELGGDSIKAMRVVSKLRENQYELTVKDIISHYVVKDIASCMMLLSDNKNNQLEVVGILPKTPIIKDFLEWNLKRPEYFNQEILLGNVDYTEEEVRCVLKELAIHHDILRMVKSGDEFEILSVSESKLYELQCVSLVEKETISKMEDICNLVHASMNLEKGPLLKSVLFDTPRGIYLFLCIHHLAVDGVSWDILLDDFKLAIKQIREGREIRLPGKTTSFIEWGKTLNEYAAKIPIKQKNYWDLIVQQVPQTNIKAVCGSGFGTGVMELSFSKEETREIQENTRLPYSTNVNEILLTALGRACYRCNGQVKTAVKIECHGREEISKGLVLDRTVGWFTSIVPIILESYDDVGKSIVAVKDMLRSIPDKGIGAGLLESVRQIQPDIYFNYMGDRDDHKDNEIFVKYSFGKSISLENKLPGAISFNGEIKNGYLTFVIKYDKTRFSDSWMNRFLDAYYSSMMEILKFCNKYEKIIKTCSDYLAEDITITDLEQIYNQVGDISGIQNIYSLTPLQKGILYSQMLDSSSTSYVVQKKYNINGELKELWLPIVLKALVLKYEVLRTVFLYKNVSKSYQIVLNEPEIEFTYECLSGNDIENDFNEICKKDIERGFNFEKDSLFRIKLVKVGISQYRMLFSFHHIIMDGWSISIVYNDFWKLYRMLLEGTTEEQLYEFSKQDSLSYGDYIEWLSQQDNDAALEYWKDVLNGYDGKADIKPSGLLIDTSEKVARKNISISNSIFNEIRKICVENHVTMNTVTEVAWGILLQKYNMMDDVVFGKITSGRNAEINSIDSVAGLFINTILSRITVDEHTTVEQLLKKIQKINMDSSSYDYCSLAEVQNSVDNGRDLVHTLFVFENYYSEKGMNLNDIGISVITESAREKVDYDIVITVSEEDNLMVEILYNPSVYTEVEIEIILKRYEKILALISSVPNNKVKSLDVITQWEKEKILGIFNNTDCDWPRESTIAELFQKQVERTPNKTAVVFNGKTLTYRELDEKSNQFADFLRNRDVEVNDFIAIMAEKDLDTLVAICGIIKAGAVYIPIDTSYPSERIKYILEDSSPKYLIKKESFEIQTKIPCIILSDSTIWEEKCDKPRPMVNPSDLAYIIYTSGTTGKPKGVMVENRNIVKLVMNADYTVMDTHSVVLQTGALAFDASTYEIWGTFLNGGELHLIDEKVLLSVKKLKNYIVLNKINTMFITTALFNQMLSLDSTIFDTLEHLMFGGEKTLEKQVILIQDKKLPLDFRNVYGPTETTTFSTHYVIDKNKRAKTPIGRPISNTKVYIMNDMQLCGICMPGELCIGGDGVSRGYYKKTELTQSKFIDNPFGDGRIYRSGDLARWLPDGNIEYIGRLDEQVKIRGFRIELGDIQTQIRQINDIKDAVVLIKESSTGDKQLVAYVVSDKSLDMSKILSYLSSQMPEYMVPSSILQVDAIPMTKNGKIDKAMLLQMDIPQVLEYVQPKNEMEVLFCDIFASVLNVDNVGIKDNFYRIGGHSLKAIQLINEIEQRVGYSIEISDVLENPTVEQLVAYVESKKQVEYKPIPKAEEKSEYVMTDIQKRMYMMQCADKDSIAYNMPSCMELLGNPDEEKIKQTFFQLVNRHSSLRTIYAIENGKWLQKIKPNANLEIPTRQAVGSIEEEFREFVKPFNLSEELPIRVQILKDNERMWLFIDIHHIAADGSSIAILQKEFEQIYNNGYASQPTKQYIDYSEWLLNQNYEEQKIFWKQVFHDEITPVQLPYDYRRKKDHKSQGATYHYKLKTELYDLIMRLTKEKSVTPNMVFIAAVSILMCRYSGHEDVVIGCPVITRNHMDSNNIVGMFVNTLPLRLYPLMSQRFTDYIENVKQYTLEAYKNKECSLADIIPEKYTNRDIMHNPLFDVALIYQNIDQYGYRGNNFTSQEKFIDTGICKFDLSFEIIQGNGLFQVALNYDRNMFKQETIIRILDEMQKVLFECLENPNIVIQDVDILTQQEKKQVLYEFNDTQKDYDICCSYLDLLQDRIRKTPNKTALVYKDENMSFRKLGMLIEYVASVICNNGAVKEDICAIMVGPSTEMFFGAIGIMRAGCAYMPIDPKYPQERVRYMLEKGKISIVLTERKFATREEFRGKKLIILDEIPFNMSVYEEYRIHRLPSLDEIKSDNLAYVIFTSGSTGNPKGVMIEHRSLVNMVLWHNNYFGLTEEDRSIKYAGFGFDASVHEMYPQLISGVEIHIIPEDLRMDMLKLHQYIEEYEITVGFMPTPICEQFMKRECKSLRMMITGGDKLKSFRDEFIVYNNYGPTENTVVSTVFPVTRYFENIPIGRPIDNVQVYVVDSNYNPVPIGISGELMISGAGIARGYLYDDKLTEERFVDNPFIPGSKMYRTGDVVRWLSDGNLEFLGRNDEQFKIRGNRVELGEIENAAKKFGNISDCVISVIEDAENVQRIVMYYVSETEIDIIELRKSLEKQLPSYMMPHLYMRIKELVYSANGKIDKKSLPTPDFNAGQVTQEIVKPENKYEKKLLDIWKSILNTKEIGVTEHFFELGGNSLLVTIMHSEIVQIYQNVVSIGDIFAYPTIRSLASIIQKRAERKEHIIKRVKMELTGDEQGSELELCYQLSDTEIAQLYDWCENDGEQIQTLLVSICEYLVGRLTQDKVHYINVRTDEMQYYEYKSEKMDEFEEIIDDVGIKLKTQEEINKFHIRDVEDNSLYHSYLKNQFSIAVCIEKIVDAKINNKHTVISQEEFKWIQKFMDLVFWFDISKEKSIVRFCLNRKEISDVKASAIYKTLIKTIKILLSE